MKNIWGEPERAPRGHDVYCTCVRACIRVGEVCLGTSEVLDSVGGYECSLGSDGWLRTSAKGQDRLKKLGKYGCLDIVVTLPSVLCPQHKYLSTVTLAGLFPREGSIKTCKRDTWGHEYH